MKAAFINKYGEANNFEIGYLPDPIISANQVIIKNMAFGINPVDWKMRKGNLWFMLGSKFPKIPGVECAGVVIQIGKNVTEFKIGDEVMAITGAEFGGHAQLVAVDQNKVSLKPKNFSFEQAGALSLAAITALQGLQTLGNIKKGQKVLINGASGGVGIFAVQIAKIFEAEVHATCSDKNMEFVKSLGADFVIDYKTNTLENLNQHFDILFDTVGSLSFSKAKKLLTKNGIYVNTLPRPIILIQQFFSSIFGQKKAKTFLAKANKNDFEWLVKHCENNQIKVIFDSIFSIDEIAKAHAKSETERAVGKIVVKY